MGLRETIKGVLGDFPFPSFWGPAAGIASSRWIADASRWVEDAHSPDLSLVYLPHLDYSLQKDGPGAPNIPQEVAAIDAVAGGLIAHYESRGVRVMVMSEYGISPVSRPVHLNRLFREKGWLSIKDELGRDTLDAGGSRVFAVADHQVAHVYVNDPTLADAARALVAADPGVAEIRQPPGGLGGARAGDFIAVAEPDAWFTYYFWSDDARAPDYARTIDIHRKPGYDPCELFLDPALRFPKLRIASFLLRKKLGIRGLLEVIPLDATLVKGSHGRDDVPDDEKPVIIGSSVPVKKATDLHAAILAHFGI
jgi:predicted AlkP superfamily pyrophosphatase or phosphodiesterase